MDHYNQTPISNELDNSDISLKPISDISKKNHKRKINTSEVLNFINDNPGSSLYVIANKLSIPFSSLYYLIEHLQKSRQVTTKITLTPENRSIKQVYPVDGEK